MRAVSRLFCAFLLTLTFEAAADDEKKAGPLLVNEGITTYTFARVDTSASDDRTTSVRLTLRNKDSIVAYVTVKVLSHTDHVVTYEPIAGEAFVVESLLSKFEVTLRSGDESHTSRFDRKAQQWRRSGSEALFSRKEKEARIVAAVIVDLQDRGVIPSASSDSESTRSESPAGMASVPCPAGSGPPQRLRGVRVNEVQYPDYGDVLGTPSGKCSGDSFACGSENVYSWASKACNAAKQNCHAKCWNQWCTGCCKFDDCNKLCMTGDYWCTATIQGYSCRQSDLM